MPQITIDNRNFMLGEGLSDFSNEKGFSNNSYCIDLGYKDGVLAAKGNYFPTIPSTITGLTFLSIAEATNASGPFVFFADANEDLHIYTNDGSNLTDTTKEDTGRNYSQWITNSIRYKDKVYVSSETDIAYDIESATPDYDWWTSTLSESALVDNVSSPHLFLIVSGVLLISNGEKIMYFDGTNHGTILSLQDTDQKITSWCLHNDNVYFTTTNGTNTQQGNNYLNIWDGRNKNNELISKDIPIPNRCLSMKSVKGELLMFFRDMLASYDGINIDKKKSINWLSAQSYNYLSCECNDSFYFIDNTLTSSSKIKVYGGGKFYNNFSIGNLSCVFSYFKTTSRDYINFLTTGLFGYFYHNAKGNDGVFYSNWYNFPENIKITDLSIEFAETMASGNANSIKIYNQKLSVLGSDPVNYREFTANYDSGGGMNNYFREYHDINFYCTSLQVVLNTFDTPIKRITINYESGRNQRVGG